MKLCLINDINILKNRYQSIMNPDYTSDIREVDRFLHEKSILLLTLFDKRIDSLTPIPNPRSKMSKNRLKDILQNNRAIDPADFALDPLKSLAKDKTKPIWDCVTTFTPQVLYTSCSMDQMNNQLRNLSELFKSFLLRYKNQHEDEGSFRVRLIEHNYQKQIRLSQRKDQSEGESFENDVAITVQELFGLLGKTAKALLQRQNSMTEVERISDNLREELIYLEAAIQFFEAYNGQQIHLSQVKTELEIFLKQVLKGIFSSLDFQIGPLAIALQPKTSYLPLLIHPLLVALHSSIKFQLRENARKDRKGDKKMKESSYRNENEGYEHSFIFNEIKSQSCSKYVFLNFDGFESEFNVDIAKYLYKNLMYISFPKQSPSTDRFEEDYLKSERLIKKYFQSGLSIEQKNFLLSAYKDSDKQIKKNLYIFPIFNKFLGKNYGLEGIQGFESSFITFILKELLYNQIQQFMPSCIIVSYSGHLSLNTEQFSEIMKELTILGNHKVIFYPNTNKNYIFSQKISPEMKFGELYARKEEDYYRRNQSNANICQNDMNGLTINTDIFQKLSIALKISSGTYTLNKKKESDQHLSKLKNYNSMAYTSKLMTLFGNENSNLSKMKMRITQYSSIIKISAKNYSTKNDNFERMFKKILSRAHKQMIKEIPKLLICDYQEIGDLELLALRKSIDRKLGQSKKAKFDKIKFLYSLEFCTQKTRTHVYAHIPPFIKTKSFGRSTDNLLCLEFEILLDNEKISIVQIPKATSIYYEESRKHENALIYVMNCPARANSNYMNFYGVISPLFDQKVEPKVQLRPIRFQGINELPSHQTYTQFNYCETNNFIFFFWPKLFDLRKEFLHKLQGTTYTPASTSLIFVARRSEPSVLRAIRVQNEQIYGDIIPRYGCSCYEVEGTQSIYIFGGFYSDYRNYLKFQTDVSVLQYRSNEDASNLQIIIQNIPKQFYLELDHQMTNRVTQIKNDPVRPRIQYEVLPYESSDDSETIFLIGGVGQNFIRPYSFITHMTHKITFNRRNGQIQKIRRIPMNTVVPINVRDPVRTRCALNTKVVTGAQNRNINCTECKMNCQGEIISRSKIIYDPEKEKFNFQDEYEFGQIDHHTYREDLSMIKKNVIETQNKMEITAKSYRGKQFNSNAITLVTPDNKKYIFQLQLQLSMDVKNVNPQLPSIVKLTGASLISIDIHKNLIYALVKHPSYTLDKCILTMFDLNDLSGKLAQNKLAEIQLKQIHLFDKNVSHNIVIIGNMYKIAILHGQKFDPQAQISQLLIIRTKKHQIKTIKVEPSPPIESDYCLTEQIVGGINTSLFLNKNDGMIFCFSFKTLEKKNESEKVYIVIELLDINELRQAIWKKLLAIDFLFKFPQSHKKREPIKLIEISVLKKQSTVKDPLSAEFKIIAYFNNKFYSTSVNFSQNKQRILQFCLDDSFNSDYFDEASQGKEKCYSVVLEKHSNLYNEFHDRHLMEEI